MKKISEILKISTLCGAMLLGSAACTEGFEEANTDPTRATLDNPAVAPFAANGLFSSSISQGLMRSFEFQRVQALYADLYAQYFATTQGYFSSDKYQINEAWLDAGWNLFYPRDIKNLLDIINSQYSTNNQKQIARIWKVFLFHRMVDFYGDMPYFNAGDPSKPEVFDSQKAIYDDFFKELAEATSKMDKTLVRSFDDKDVIYKGNTASWITFGNTLRLRLALRISKVDAAKAKTEAEAAIAAGVFTSNANNALAAVSSTQPNAFNQITGFSEFRMSATSESLLVGYEDPRATEFFSPVVGATATSPFKDKIKGLRNGLTGAQLGEDENKFANNSNVGPRFSVAQQNTNPRIVLTYAEACFLQAEAKINGWAGAGTAKEWYENGIKASMNQFGIADAAKITAYTASVKVPSTPLGVTRGISSLPVRFSAVEAEQREQVGIQKWIAVYPDGFEAWSEFRRTGFPKFYQVANYDSGTDVTPGNFIQRIPYTANVRALNKSGVDAAESRMGGAGQSVKLWFAGGK
jgi:hypothetical protein